MSGRRFMRKTGLWSYAQRPPASTRAFEARRTAARRRRLRLDTHGQRMRRLMAPGFRLAVA